MQFGWEGGGHFAGELKRNREREKATCEKLATVVSRRGRYERGGESKEQTK